MSVSFLVEKALLSWPAPGSLLFFSVGYLYPVLVGEWPKNNSGVLSSLKISLLSFF